MNVFRDRATTKQIASAIVLIGLAAFSCDRPALPESKSENAKTVAEWKGKNCLIIVLDALTVRHLSIWGYERETTPFLNKLAQRGTVFLTARSQASSTLPSAFSYFTGKYPPLMLQEGTGSVTEPVRVPESEQTFTETFKEGGYETFGLSANINVSSILGFDQGFDTFAYTPRYLALNTDTGEIVDHYEPDGRRMPAYISVKPDNTATARILDEAQQWIRTQDSPWFCYLHLLRPHNPYKAPEPLGTTYSNRYTGPADGSGVYWKKVGWKPPMEDVPHLKNYYDGNIRYIDAELERFFSALENAGAMEDTAIIMVSDHGEAFMEHGYALHNESVHEELLHVPLIIVPPISLGGSISSTTESVQLIDLFPTMTELYGLQTPKDLDGISLAPAMKGQPLDTTRRVYAQNMRGNIACVISDGTKLIAKYNESGARFLPREIYRLREDPLEQHNVLIGASLSETTRLLKLIEEYAAQHAYQSTEGPVEFPDFDLQVLNALGYI